MEDEVVKKSDLESRLKESIHSSIASFMPTESEYEKIRSFLENYPTYQLKRLDKGELKTPKNQIQQLRENYKKKLEEILEIKEKIRKNEKIDLDDEEYIFGVDSSAKRTRTASVKMLFDDSYKNYDIEFYKPGDEGQTIKRMAKKAKICWEKDDFDDYSKNLARDCTEYGGSIIYFVSKKNGGCAFVRCFVGIDEKNRSYLFMDLLEGKKGYSTFIHSPTEWIEEAIEGIFKKAVFAAIYISKKAGVDYFVAGDSGVADFLEAVGCGKIRTSSHGRNKKIGLSASEEPDKNQVKSYFFSDSKNYGAYLDNLDLGGAEKAEKDRDKKPVQREGFEPSKA